MSQPPRARILFLSACAGILVFGIVFAVWELSSACLQCGRVCRLISRTREIFFSCSISEYSVHRLSSVRSSIILVNKAQLLISSAIVAAAMLGFAAAHSFVAASLAALLLGFGGGGLNTCTNVLVSDLYGDQRGPMLEFARYLLWCRRVIRPPARRHDRRTLHDCSALCFLRCARFRLCGRIRRNFFPARQSWPGIFLGEAFGVAKYKGILLLGFILFFESGNEASIGGWTSTYVNGAGYSPRAATLALAAYWAALMLGRILAARMLDAFAKSTLVAWSATVSLVGCAILLTAHLFWFFLLGTALIGLSYGPIFPTTLAIAGDRYSERAGTVFGLLFSIALIGGMLLPWAVGQVSQQFGLRLGMLVPGLGAVGITVLAIVFMLRERLAGQSPEPARR